MVNQQLPTAIEKGLVPPDVLDRALTNVLTVRRLSSASARIGAPLTATIDVSNSGDRDGEEVAQGYVTAEKASVPMPSRQLWAFERVNIPKGQTANVKLTFDTANFGHWDKDTQQFVIEPGVFDIQVGAASDDLRATAKVTLSR